MWFLRRDEASESSRARRSYNNTLCLLVLTASLIFCLANAFQLPNDVIPNNLGVNIHFTHPQPGELEMLNGEGFRWIRMDFCWSCIETTPGQYDFASYDVLVAALKQQNMSALFILDYGNPLYDQGHAPYTDAGRTAFANFALAGISRYSGLGYVWEIWNEPNIQFWQPSPSPVNYTLLALAVSKTVKPAYPDEIIIGPATSQLDVAFITTCFENGLLNAVDAVSFHPYRQTNPETATADFATLRSLIANYTDVDMPIISSEWGYSTLYSNVKNVTQQAKFLPRMLLNNLANKIALSIYYDWVDDCTDPLNDECHFGTVYSTYYPNRIPPYDPKPNYESAQTMMTVLKDFYFVGQLNATDYNEDDYLFLFTNNNNQTQTALAAWTTSLDVQSATVAVPAGCYNVFSYQGDFLPVACTSTDNVLSLMLTDAPTYYVLQ
eukprot:TRINITY_DN3502_c0_g1_i1.p1 TRINITY_DN3502_c0_g1~~TRINITY_DN3502_c0_g1_i1.p1  ORF type:complete len:437 (+),score=71.21 TRINITY_DN3502_c0_g1_i1:50-1360(+)